uniref:Chemosensory protein 9 n=1 Tax=Heliconius charithonia TaxID=33434 RepID=A0AA49FPM5_HELCH|nr:chemosensory protein 9 [Heliconius charithonia]
MKVIVILVCLCVTVLSQDIESMKNMPKYDSRYDYLDVDALFNSKRLVRNYVECLINGQRCTPEGKALKRLLPEALRTKCIRCTERQKKTAVKIIKRLKNEYPEEWAKLSSKWDPTGDFTRYFEVFLANEQFNTIPANGNEVSKSPEPTLTVRPVPTSPPSSETPVAAATPPPPPLLLNRFNDDGEIMVGSPSSAITTPRTTQPSIRTVSTTRPIMPQRPTAIPWGSVGPDTIPTRFTLRPTNELPLPYSTAITLIDQIGIKIIRTTELVTDILRNTVRAVIGR